MVLASTKARKHRMRWAACLTQPAVREIPTNLYIDRTKHLLERRGRIEEQRSCARTGRAEEGVSLPCGNTPRARRASGLGSYLARHHVPAWSSAPLGIGHSGLSVARLTAPQTCYDSLGLFRSDVAPLGRQRVPGGAFGKRNYPSEPALGPQTLPAVL